MEKVCFPNHGFRPQQKFLEKVCFPLMRQTFPANLNFTPAKVSGKGSFPASETSFSQKPEFSGKLTSAVNHSFRPQ